MNYVHYVFLFLQFDNTFINFYQGFMEFLLKENFEYPLDTIN